MSEPAPRGRGQRALQRTGSYPLIDKGKMGIGFRGYWCGIPEAPGHRRAPLARAYETQCIPVGREPTWFACER
jgi:hypothetical protein